jgi:hypothetical protein
MCLRMPAIWVLLFTTVFTATVERLSAQESNASATPSFVLNNATSQPESVVEEVSRVSYILPFLSVTLEVTKSDNGLILFQDRLQELIELYLENFYEVKLGADSYGNSSMIEIAFKSQLVWRELSVDLDKSKSNLEHQEDEVRKHYEVRGTYDGHIVFNLDSARTSFVSQSLTNLLFIEAFQADNYWALVHSFLVNPALQEIDDVTVAVSEDGFVPYDGQPSVAALDDWNGRGTNISSNLTPAMITGVAVATLFCIALLGMWTYLCFMVNGASFFNGVGQRRAGDVFYKGGSVTDDTFTNDSLDFPPDEESAWMDAWAQAVTSIPMREPAKTRRKRGRPTKQSFVRPAHEHHPSLDCIDEADNESCASGRSESSRKGGRRSRKVEKGGRHVQRSTSAPSTITSNCYFQTEPELGSSAPANQPHPIDPPRIVSGRSEDPQDYVFTHRLSDQLSTDDRIRHYENIRPRVTSLASRDRLSI